MLTDMTISNFSSSSSSSANGMKNDYSHSKSVHAIEKPDLPSKPSGLQSPQMMSTSYKSGRYFCCCRLYFYF